MDPISLRNLGQRPCRRGCQKGPALPNSTQDWQFSLSLAKAKIKKHYQSKYHEATQDKVRKYQTINPNNKPFDLTGRTRAANSTILALRTEALTRCIACGNKNKCMLCLREQTFDTTHYLIECPVSGPKFRPLLDKLSLKELDSDPQTQAYTILQKYSKKKGPLEKLLLVRPPEVCCPIGHRGGRGFNSYRDSISII